MTRLLAIAAGESRVAHFYHYGGVDSSHASRSFWGCVNE